MLLAVSDVVWQAVIAGTVTVVLATINLVGVIITIVLQRNASKERQAVKETLAQRTNETDTKLDHVARSVEEVHKATNSMKDELVASVKQAATLQGHAEGVASQKADAAAIDKTNRSVDRLP